MHKIKYIVRRFDCGYQSEILCESFNNDQIAFKYYTELCKRKVTYLIKYFSLYELVDGVEILLSKFEK